MSDKMAALARATEELIAENEALRAQLKHRDELIESLTKTIDERGTLGVLQMMAHDMRLPANIRVKAAEIAISYERAKPPIAVAAHIDFSLFNLLEEKRLARQKPATIDVTPNKAS
jgi:hypothetical protein